MMTISDWVAFWYAEGEPMTPAEAASYYAGWTQLGSIDKGADDYGRFLGVHDYCYSDGEDE